MKIKVSDATNIQLDWMVAKCENKMWLDYENALNNESPLPLRPSEFLRDYDWSPEFSPSTKPSQAYPIIEREKICTEGRPGHTEGWAAHYSKKNEKDYFYSIATTPLVAAMRCYVSSTLGDEVEIPEEDHDQD